MAPDKAADREIDRLLRERKEAEAKLQPPEKTEEEVKEEIREKVPVGLRRDPDILKLIETEGKIPDDFLGDLVGAKLRQGL